MNYYTKTEKVNDRVYNEYVSYNPETNEFISLLSTLFPDTSISWTLHKSIKLDNKLGDYGYNPDEPANFEKAKNSYINFVVKSLNLNFSQ